MIDPVSLIALANLIDGIVRDLQSRPASPQTTPQEAELLRSLTQTRITLTQYLLRNPPPEKAAT